MASRTSDVGRLGQDQSFELRSSDLPSSCLIGKGLCGIVYETMWNGERYARKDFADSSKEIFLKEAKVLVEVREHKNVVKTFGWSVENRTCSLVMELMDDDLLSLLQKKMESKRNEAVRASEKLAEASSVTRPSLHESIEERSTSPRPFELQESLHFLLEIASGMAHLHEQNIAHGDLKPRNVLVTYSKVGVISLKVADFGLVQTKRHSTLFVSRGARMLDMAQWKAPEYLRLMFRHKPYTELLESDSDEDLDIASTSDDYDWLKADVYSFAVTCFQILTGEVAYPNRNWRLLVKEILDDDGSRPRFPASFQPKMLTDLLELCWSADISQRPTFSDICIRLKEILDERRGFMQLGDNLKGNLEIDMIPKLTERLVPKQGRSKEGPIEVETGTRLSGGRGKVLAEIEMLQALDVNPRERLGINTLLPKQGQGKEGPIQVKTDTRHSGGSAQGLGEIEMPKSSTPECPVEAWGNKNMGEQEHELDLERGGPRTLGDVITDRRESRSLHLLQIDNILWTKRLPPSHANRCKEALKTWKEKENLFTSRINTNKKRMREFQNQVYQVIGFNILFQGLLFNAAAQSNLLHCNNWFTAPLLSVTATIASQFVVTQNLLIIQSLMKTNVNEVFTLKTLVRWQFRLLIDGPKFDFARLDGGVGSYIERYIERQPRLIFVRLVLYTCFHAFLFGAVMVSSRQILCHPGPSLLPASPY